MLIKTFAEIDAPWESDCRNMAGEAMDKLIPVVAAMPKPPHLTDEHLEDRHVDSEVTRKEVDDFKKQYGTNLLVAPPLQYQRSTMSVVEWRFETKEEQVGEKKVEGEKAKAESRVGVAASSVGGDSVSGGPPPAGGRAGGTHTEQDKGKKDIALTLEEAARIAGFSKVPQSGMTFVTKGEDGEGGCVEYGGPPPRGEKGGGGYRLVLRS